MEPERCSQCGARRDADALAAERLEAWFSAEIRNRELTRYYGIACCIAFFAGLVAIDCALSHDGQGGLGELVGPALTVALVIWIVHAPLRWLWDRILTAWYNRPIR